MPLTTDQFQRVAETVAQRAADLLGAGTVATDARGAPIARGRPTSVDAPGDAPAIEAAGGPALDANAASLRVPFRFGDREGEILVGEPLTGELVPPRVAQVLLDLLISQVAGIERLPNQHELKNRFINDLLHGAVRSEEAVLREAQILGMDLAPPRAVILIDAADYILPQPGKSRVRDLDAHIQRRAQVVIASVVGFFDLPTDTICGYIGDGEIAVLKASSTQDLSAWTDGAGEPGVSPSWANLTALKRAASALLLRLRRDTRAAVNIGIGRYHPGVSGLARSYQDARTALSLGRRSLGRNQVHCLDGLGVAAFVGVADERTKFDLAQHLLSPLDHEPDLLLTVATFFEEDCCPSSAAGRLSIHRNTLKYRLDKVASLTGLDPRRFDDAVQIRLALLLRSLR